MTEVARHRRAEIRSLSEVLEGYADLGQTRWVRWRRNNAQHLPEQFAPVLQEVIAFADPVVTGQARGRTWDHEDGAWV